MTNDILETEVPAGALNETLKATGCLDIVLTDENGNVKEEKHVPNLVVTVGKQWIAARMKDTGLPTQMTHMAIGSSNTAAAIADATLGVELGRTALSTAGGSVAGAVVTYGASFAAGTGTGAVVEAAILNAATAGTMLCRTVFDVVNKGANDTMTITWTVTIS